MNHIYGGGTHFRDVRNLVLRVTSQKKIEANRLNAGSSTGPVTSRGKALSRFNAVRHGAFALRRLIPGEDRQEYDQLSSRFVDETDPQTVVESVLVDQIIGDIWRLKRLERAELAYFHEIRKSMLTRALISMTDKEFSIAERIIEDQDQIREVQATRDVRKAEEAEEAERLRNERQEQAVGLRSGFFAIPSQPLIRDESTKRSSRPDDEVNLSTVKRQLEEIDDVGAILLDAMGDDDNSFPITLDRTRNSIVRELMRRYAVLAEIQDRRRSDDTEVLSA